MQRMLMGIWITLIVAVVAAGYIRLAPASPDKWHQPLDFEQSRDLEHGVMRVIDLGEGDAQRLDVIIRATPRTSVLFGGLAGGRVTYVTRSAVMGFPDYTTIERHGDTMRLYARLRFGASDFGVNKARVEGWIEALGQGG